MTTHDLHTPVGRRVDQNDLRVACRPATSSDLPALVGLLEEIMTHHGVNLPRREDLERTLAEMLAEAEISTRPRYLFLVAEDRGRVIGTCSLIFSLSTWSTGEVCELQDVVVSKDERHAGVGHALLQAATKVARSRGCLRVFLQAEAANLDAHAFYRSQGFDEKTALHFEHDLSDPGPRGVQTPSD
jgi:GNAT superfamily N-acetyltransferase